MPDHQYFRSTVLLTFNCNTMNRRSHLVFACLLLFPFIWTTSSSQSKLILDPVPFEPTGTEVDLQAPELPAPRTEPGTTVSISPEGQIFTSAGIAGDEFWEVPVPSDIIPSYWSVNAIATTLTHIYVGGSFSEAGSVAARNIARYNRATEQWESLGTEEENGIEGTVEAIVVRDGKVFVGGRFTRAGTLAVQGLAVFDEETDGWDSLGGSLGYTAGAPAVKVLRFNQEGDLYVGGIFTIAGGVQVSHLARWDGQTWHDVGGGVRDSFNPEVAAIHLKDGKVYVAGDFTSVGDNIPAQRIAVWDGQTWETLDAGLHNFATVNGITDGPAGSVVVYGRGLGQSQLGWFHALVWNGSQWSGINGLITQDLDGSMALEGLDVDAQNRITVAGRFTTIDGNYVNNIARLDQAGWHPLSKGIYYSANVLIPDGEGFLTGGRFARAGEVKATGIARWDGTAWNAVGSGVRGGLQGSFSAIAPGPDGRIYAGGFFQSIGSVAASNVAEWTGSEWQPLGEGLNGNVITLATGPDGSLYAGGSFTASGDDNVVAIARWDGSAWLPMLNDQWDEVLKIRLFGSRLLASGITTDNTASVAEFTGDSWQTIGGEADPVPVAQNFVNLPSIRDFALNDDGDLYIGGYFTTVNQETVSATNVARWDGTIWHALGSGAGSEGDPSDRVYALAWQDGHLYVGGQFTQVNGSSASAIARWTETTQRWVNFNGGAVATTGFPSVRSIEAIDQNLVIAGYFNRIAGTDARGIAVLENGASMQALGSGVEGSIVNINRDGAGALYVAGNFTSAGGKEAAGIAKWTDVLTGVQEAVDRSGNARVTLSQNPVQDRTLFHITLAQPSPVRITIHSLLGQRVATVTQESFEAGDFSVAWHPSDLAPGVYMYRMTTMNSEVSGKLLLLP